MQAKETIMLRYFILPLITGLALSGCAQLPAEQELSQYPIITFGESVPSDKPYILHFRAGQAIPTAVLIDGDLLKQTAAQTLTVSLDRDIYSYKQWASFDGKHWQQANKLLSIKLKVKVPGYTHPHNGSIHLSVNRQPDS
jgi:hypothetical protein